MTVGFVLRHMPERTAIGTALIGVQPGLAATFCEAMLLMVALSAFSAREDRTLPPRSTSETMARLSTGPDLPFWQPNSGTAKTIVG
jgi:hypothetical protein